MEEEVLRNEHSHVSVSSVDSFAVFVIGVRENVRKDHVGGRQVGIKTVNCSIGSYKMLVRLYSVMVLHTIAAPSYLVFFEI